MAIKFKASHITGGNLIFPDKLEIDDTKIVFYKGHIIGYDEIVIQRESIGCINVNIGLLFGDVTIETKGGQHILANGFTRGDAKKIRDILTD